MSNRWTFVIADHVHIFNQELGLSFEDFLRSCLHDLRVDVSDHGDQEVKEYNGV